MKNCCICEEMKVLWKEQKMLAEFCKGFRFVHLPKMKDTIPFMLQSSDEQAPFTAIIDGGTTSYFRLEKLDDNCCAQLTLLKPINFKGRLAVTPEDLYALKKTSLCIHVEICSFCAITPLSIDLIDRPLPIIESKM